MAIVKCSKGHYYDNTKFSQCPHCGVLPIMEQEQQEAAKPKRFSFFHKPDMKKPEVSVPDEDDDHTVAMPVAPKPFLSDEDDDHTIAMPKAPTGFVPDEEDDDHTVAMPVAPMTSAVQEPEEDDDHTIAMPVAPMASAVQEPEEDDDHTIAMPVAPMASAVQEPEEDDDHTIAMPVMPETVAAETSEDDDRTIAVPGLQNAEAAMSDTADEDDDRTIAVPKPQNAEPAVSGPEDEDDDRTIAVPRPQTAKPAAAEPEVLSAGAKPAAFVVGWLVCVSGPERGCDYRLYRGFNRLGGGSRMDIQIKGDPELGDGAALAVVYDDRSNEFFAVQQTGGNAFLNGESLQGAVRLSSGDVVKAGGSEFEFVAFCREGRIWESYE